MTSRLPRLGAMISELALRAVGAVVPGVQRDIDAMFDARRVYPRTISARETPAVLNNGLDGRRAVSAFLGVFLVLFAKWYLLMREQAPRIMSCTILPDVYYILQTLWLPLLGIRVIIPTEGQDRPPPRAPSSIHAYFLAFFVRSFIAMTGQVLRIMPSVQPGLHDVLNSLMAPAIALNATHLTLHNPSVQLDRKFFDAGTSKDEQRVLRDLAKFFVKLQNFLGGGGGMSTADKGKTVSALVAAKIATPRTRGLFSVKVNALLAPVLDVSKLFRHRAGTEKTSERRQVYLLGILFRRSIAMEEVLEQAIWTRNWPVIPAELATIGNLLSIKTGTTANKTAAPSGVLCVRRRNASATIDPRATHLRGSGAVVAK